MTKFPAVFTLATLFAFSVLSGCNKATDSTAKAEAPTAPEAPAAPTAPTAVGTGGQQDKTAPSVTNSSASVNASVSANGTEARAGDVAVKLPD
jgi:hypothetical protein